jgi:NADH:ubiquinone oxidoreductase subunit 6 (subunit J)
MFQVLNPYRTTLKYDVNPIKSTVTLTPTLGSVVRTSLVPLLPLAAMLVTMSVIGTVLIKSEEKKTETPEDPDEK